MDLYCDQDECNMSHGGAYTGCGPAQYTANTGGRARRDARCDGWVLHRDGTATCPSCNAPAPSAKEGTHCCRCNDTRVVPSRCSDPQCGDSTWDHLCDLGGEDPCPACAPSAKEGRA